MKAIQVVEQLPVLAPAMMDVAGLAGLSIRQGDAMAGFTTDLDGLAALPVFERSTWAKVIPVDKGLNTKPGSLHVLGTGDYGQALGVMDVHGAIRYGLSRGVRAMGQISVYGSELGLVNTVKAGRAVKDFARFAVVRATQIDLNGWRRGGGQTDYDGEGRYIARHRDSYTALRPLMTGYFRSLVDQAIASY